jgi:hypothetical protein
MYPSIGKYLDSDLNEQLKNKEPKVCTLVQKLGFVWEDFPLLVDIFDPS